MSAGNRKGLPEIIGRQPGKIQWASENGGKKSQGLKCHWNTSNLLYIASDTVSPSFNWFLAGYCSCCRFTLDNLKSAFQIETNPVKINHGNNGNNLGNFELGFWAIKYSATCSRLDLAYGNGQRVWTVDPHSKNPLQNSELIRKYNFKDIRKMGNSFMSMDSISELLLT